MLGSVNTSHSDAPHTPKPTYIICREMSSHTSRLFIAIVHRKSAIDRRPFHGKSAVLSVTHITVYGEKHLLAAVIAYNVQVSGGSAYLHLKHLNLNIVEGSMAKECRSGPI